jgi:hypothetical protein
LHSSPQCQIDAFHQASCRDVCHLLNGALLVLLPSAATRALEALAGHPFAGSSSHDSQRNPGINELKATDEESGKHYTFACRHGTGRPKPELQVW